MTLNTSPNAMFPSTDTYQPINHLLSRILHKLQFLRGSRNISALGVKAVGLLQEPEVPAVPLAVGLTCDQDLWRPLLSSPVGWAV